MAGPTLDEAAIFNAARQIDAPDARRQYLQEACGEDPKLLKRIEALLQAHGEKATFLDSATVIQGIIGITRDGPGTQIGPYRLLEPIGEGGMGAVFRAEQLQPIQRRVAVKVIKAGMDSKAVLARFEAERQALALMDHPNIAKVFDAGATQNGRPFFVMELIEGVPITKFCDEQRLTLRERLQLLVPVCEAIQHAHQKGIIHRDIKPSNVLVALYDDKAVPKVIDFGIAKAVSVKLTEETLQTGLGAIIGTPEYMSPEQAEPGQADIDTRSDIFSLGVLLYELLTGSTPLQAARSSGVAVLELLRLVREQEPPKPSTRLDTTEELAPVAVNRSVEPKRLSRLVRGDLDWIVMKCLEKDRTRRYATANGLARDIERYLNDEPVEACPPSRSYRLRKFARKNRKLLLGAAAFVLLLTAGIVVSAWEAVRAVRAEREALAARDREAEQRQLAEKSAAEAAAVLKFFRERVLSAARPKGEEGGLGKDATIREALDRAEPEIAKAFGDKPLVEASIRHTMAQTYSQLGELGLAIPQQERALALWKTHRGLEHRDTLGAMNNLAIMMMGQGRTEEGRKLFAEVVALKKRVLGPEDPDTLRSMNNLANVMWTQGDLAGARKLFEEVLETQKRVQGLKEPDTMRSMNNLAVVLQKQAHLKEARKQFEEVLELQREVLTREHPQTLATMTNLASVLEDLGQLDAADKLYQETLDIQQQLLPETHLSVLTTMNNLAGLRRLQLRWQDSRKLFEKTLALQRKSLLSGHPEMVRTIGNLAWLLAVALDPEARDPMRALALAKEVIDYPPGAGNKWTTLGVAYYRTGDWKQAIATFENPQAAPTGRYVALNGFFLAMAYCQLGEKDKARPWYDKASRWVEKNLPDDLELHEVRNEASQVLGLPDAPAPVEKPGK